MAVAADGIAGFASAYQLASRAAQTVPRGHTQLVMVNDRLPRGAAGRQPGGRRRCSSRSRSGRCWPSPPHQAELLLETLVALLEHNGSPTHAAESLFCHRNTVIYRMKQIEQLTGRSLQVPRDRLLLVLGLITTGRSSRGAAPLHA